MVFHGLFSSFQGRGAAGRSFEGVSQVIAHQEEAGQRTRLAPWLKRPRYSDPCTMDVRLSLQRGGLETVCEEAVCPNRDECWASKTATFLVLGKKCTRCCAFCAVQKGVPAEPDREEPARVARTAAEMGLKHVVITSVTRDDLADGGAFHFSQCVAAARKAIAGASVEVLTPDFFGNEDLVARVVDSAPEVFGHNLETVERLSGEIRPQAGYARSLGVLAAAARRGTGMVVKSGIMLGLGETENDIAASLRDLLDAGCRVVTLGQYLRPTLHQIPVKRYVPPAEFEHWRLAALKMGFAYAASSPFTRSSHQARLAYEFVSGARG